MKSALVLLMLLGGIGTVNAAQIGVGGSGLNFSCDVNKRQCECTGVEEGADCQAMKKNCGENRLNCFKDLKYQDICICTMARLAPKQQNIIVAPELKVAPQ